MTQMGTTVSHRIVKPVGTGISGLQYHSYRHKQFLAVLLKYMINPQPTLEEILEQARLELDEQLLQLEIRAEKDAVFEFLSERQEDAACLI